MSDCEKCWDTPCTCGHEYRNYTNERKEGLAAAVLGIKVDDLHAALGRQPEAQSAPCAGALPAGHELASETGASPLGKGDSAGHAPIAAQVPVALDMRNVSNIKRSSDQSVTVEFPSCRSASQFAIELEALRTAPPAPQAESELPPLRADELALQVGAEPMISCFDQGKEGAPITAYKFKPEQLERFAALAASSQAQQPSELQRTPARAPEAADGANADLLLALQAVTTALHWYADPDNWQDCVALLSMADGPAYKRAADALADAKAKSGAA